ncbi:TetR/AcrR family transcriptional regulator [Streptomyces sp. ITFR-16]|uniref:TetR/AcrR family transcriptional regulator n=1 Tax=Streptomyces sp. ITFR-16 TaxID=3075198 RepID=UPI00288C0358|nr:TetR/AcrR family transcriptional regulator [Streptomyces sp. ITFR-16]WNI24710.1 TetR/AcrR family transcriptional regulator [Streptomyces sp. ITFR-16]
MSEARAEGSGDTGATEATGAAGAARAAGAAKSPERRTGTGRKAGGGEDAPAQARPRRRQARGEARIAQLLKAAANVFCTTGYTAASTNAIAREAGVSPGTLYQFFPNKEAIAVELGDQLLTRWRETYGAAFLADHLELPLDRMLDATLDPLIAFNCENPAFTVLIHGSEIPGAVTQDHDAVHTTMLSRVEAVLAGYLPDTPPAEVARVATMIFTLFKAALDVIMAHEGEEREAYIRELKTILHRYLEPMIGDRAAGSLPASAPSNGG